MNNITWDQLVKIAIEEYNLESTICPFRKIDCIKTHLGIFLYKDYCIMNIMSKIYSETDVIIKDCNYDSMLNIIKNMFKKE